MLDSASVTRRLMVVDPCDECRRLLPGLSNAGWDVETCALEQSDARSCDVGLLRVQQFHLTHLDAIKKMIASSGAEWIAVLDPELHALKSFRDLVGEWFFDFHTLPFDVARAMITLGRAFGMACLREQSVSNLDDERHELLGESEPICEVRKLLAKLAPTDSPVLIRGESGTGKELVARTLHRLSRRDGMPSVAINCGAIPENLIQSELFGHEKGAFTGAHQRKIGRIEAADGGTLFLDEIGDLPMEMQANLLRFLQEKHIERVGGSKPIEVNARVIAATHIDLEEAVAKGTFREDLYYRLNVLQVQMPPLRERLLDLPQLAHHFASLFSAETGRRPRRFSEASLQAMAAYDWPGNVRELTNRVRRGLVLAEGRQIEPADLGLTPVETLWPKIVTLEDYRLQAERQALREAMLHYAENHSQAARMLGISRPTFYRLLHKHQLG